MGRGEIGFSLVRKFFEVHEYLVKAKRYPIGGIRELPEGDRRDTGGGPP